MPTTFLLVNPDFQTFCNLWREYWNWRNNPIKTQMKLKKLAKALLKMIPPNCELFGANIIWFLLSPLHRFFVAKSIIKHQAYLLSFFFLLLKSKKWIIPTYYILILQDGSYEDENQFSWMKISEAYLSYFG